MFYGMDKNNRAIRDDVAVLREDVAKAAADAKEEVMAAAQAAFGRAQEKIGAAGERGRAMGKQVDHYVHENSWVAIGIAAAAGLLLGMLMHRGRRGD